MVEVALGGLLLDSPHSGTATYTRNLVPLLPGAAPDLGFRLYGRNPADPLGNVPYRRIQTPFRGLNHGRGVGARLDKLTWEVVSLPLAAALEGASLIHSLYFAAPVLAAAPIVVTVHDVIPLVLPDYHRSRQAVVYARVMAETVKRVGAIITVSEYSKRDIVRVLGVPGDRVHVIYEAASPDFGFAVTPDEEDRVRREYRLPARFLLYLGGAERRKNLEVLVKAWHRVAGQMRRREVRLVLVAGFPPPDRLYPDVPGLISALDLENDITVVPRVAEADKPAVYRAALGFCFPSLYEGFGLTPLEAMAARVPVLASNATSIPEVTGSAAELLPPDDVGSWGDAMLALVDSAAWRRDLIARGAERAERFSWEKTAAQTADVYRSVLAQCAS
jgi:glycosyltransferase involved in cell wall biosynthesis